MSGYGVGCEEVFLGPMSIITLLYIPSKTDVEYKPFHFLPTLLAWLGLSQIELKVHMYL
jgi:hypothetical protein